MIRATPPLRIALLAIAAAALIGAAPLRYTLDSAASSIDAKVSFLGIGSRTATFKTLSGAVTIVPDQPRNSMVDVTIHTQNIKAPDALTLKRLKSDKFFWVEKYPTARFVGSSLTMTGARSGRMSGKLTARGITRPETLNIVFDRPPSTAVGEALELTGQMKIDRRNYGMKSYSLIVGKTVTINMKARIVPG